MMRCAFFVALWAGCYNPAYQDCAVACTPSVGCPSGFECIGNVCRSEMGPCPMMTDAPEAGSWQFRKRVGILPTADVRSFPALIRTFDDADLARSTKPMGEDIKFTTIDGIKLPHEIEHYDQASGTLAAWVQIPMLSASTPTELYMYYGNPSAADQQQRAAVWDAGYLGVWHLDDPIGSTVTDSTAAAHDGTKGVSNTPGLVDGLIAGGLQFNGTTTDYFGLGLGSDLDAPVLTFETWIKVQAAAAALGPHRVFDVPATFVNQPGLGYRDNDAAADPGLWQVQPSDRQMSPLQTDPNVITINWSYVVAVFDRTDSLLTLSIDGQSRQLFSSGTLGQVPAGTNVTIGGNTNGSPIPGPNGILDEVRLSKVARSHDYVVASMMFVQALQPVVNFGAAETVP